MMSAAYFRHSKSVEVFIYFQNNVAVEAILIKAQR